MVPWSVGVVASSQVTANAPAHPSLGHGAGYPARCHECTTVLVIPTRPAPLCRGWPGAWCP
eukprot:10270203-Alexandrium_andersonii.AAC.1